MLLQLNLRKILINIELSQKKEIKVVKRGQVIFTIVPERDALLAEAESYFNTLPKGTTISVDPDEKG